MHPVTPVNTKTTVAKTVVNPIATPVFPLTMIKRHVLNVSMVNTKIKTIKPVVNPIALPVFPSTMLKRPVPNALINTKIKPINLVARIVPLVLP